MKVLVVSFQSLTQDSGAGMARLGYFLAQKMHSKGELDRFVVSSKGKFTTPFPSVPVSFFSRYYLFILNKLTSLFKLPDYYKRTIEETLFDFFCQYKISSETTLIVTTNAFLYRTTKRAHKKGIKVIHIAGNPHDNYIRERVAAEYQKYSLKERLDVYTYKRRTTFYNKSVGEVDYHIAFNSLIQESFLRYGFKNVVLVKGLFKSSVADRDALIKREGKKEIVIVYLAYTVVLKGLHNLLKIVEELDSDKFILKIGGTIDPSVEPFLSDKARTLKNVKFMGLVKDKDAFFEDADLFACPSIIDGLPVAAIEAMAYGVAPVITNYCGIKDFVINYDNGVIVSSDAELKQALNHLYSDKALISKMGYNANKTVKENKIEDFIHALYAETIRLSNNNIKG